MTSRRDSGGGPGPRFPWSGTAAIAGLTLRAAVRSRFFASLLALVLAAVVALALTLKGDGTCAGRARVVIAYTLGLAGGILGFATLWNACGSISLDVEERQIRLVAVKPVRAWQVWLGKWMGLVGLNAALLTAAGGATYAMLTGWAGRLPAAEREALGGGILVGRRVLAPAQAPAGGEVRRRYRELEARGALPAGLDPREIREAIRRDVLRARMVVAPGATRTWEIPLPARRRAPPADGVALRVRLSTVGIGREPATGAWRIGGAGNAQLARIEHCALRPGVQDLPLASPELARAIAGGGTLTVTWENAGADASRTVLFDPAGGVQVLVRESGFGANLVRALAVMLCYLALVAAVGLSAGAVFSFPVAVFAGGSLIAIAAMVRFLSFATGEGADLYRHEHGGAQEPAALERLGIQAVRGADALVAPAMRFAPLGLLSDGLLVSWKFTAGAAGILGALYPAVLGYVAARLLRRRELALPGG